MPRVRQTRESSRERSNEITRLKKQNKKLLEDVEKINKLVDKIKEDYAVHDEKSEDRERFSECLQGFLKTSISLAEKSAESFKNKELMLKGTIVFLCILCVVLCVVLYVNMNMFYEQASRCLEAVKELSEIK